MPVELLVSLGVCIFRCVVVHTAMSAFWCVRLASSSMPIFISAPTPTAASNVNLDHGMSLEVLVHVNGTGEGGVTEEKMRCNGYRRSFALLARANTENIIVALVPKEKA